MVHQVEHVARAFFDVQNETGVWEHQPEDIKQRFREDARAAIALLHESQGSGSQISAVYDEINDDALKLSDAA